MNMKEMSIFDFLFVQPSLNMNKNLSPAYDDDVDSGTLGLIKLPTFPKWDTETGRELCMEILMSMVLVSLEDVDKYLNDRPDI